MIQPTNMQQPYPAQGGANAVSINIFNPQAYGAAQNQQQAAAVQTPNYTNSLYNMPQASLYQPQQPQFPMGAPQMLPAYQPVTPQYNPEMFNQYAIIPPQGMTMQTAQPIAQIMPQEPVAQAAPAPQMMPASVLQPQGYNGPQLVQTSPQEVLEQELTPAQKEEYKGPQLVETQPQVEEYKAPQLIDSTPKTQETPSEILPEQLIEGLKSTDSKVREATINTIARETQVNPNAKQKLVSEPIMQGLINIINEDTSKLQGPTDEQIAVAEKIVRGEKLTPEEEAISDNLAPRDAANLNRAYSLYTLAMLQKLQRDEVDEYIENQKANGQETINPMKISDLYGYNDVVNVIQNDSRSEVQIAAMQALRYVARPEDKAELEKVLAKPLASQDADVKKTAQDIMDEMPTKDAEILQMPQESANKAA